MINNIIAGMILSTGVTYASDCSYIKDHDLRRTCIAEQKKKSESCTFVTDHDSRNVCYARTQSNKSACNRVKDHDRRQACKAGMGW